MATINEWRRYMAPTRVAAMGQPGPSDPAEAAARVARQRMLRVTEAMDPTRQALEQHIAQLEDALRFHDAAEGPQYFAEQAERDLIQRELDRARAQLREGQS